MEQTETIEGELDLGWIKKKGELHGDLERCGSTESRD